MKSRMSLVDQARFVIRDSGMADNITSKWLAEMMGIASSDAGSILAGLVRSKEIVIHSRERGEKGPVVNHCKVVKLNIVPASMKRESADESMKRLAATMAAFHPATKRHDLRGTA